MIICEMSNCQWGIVTYLIYIYFLTLFLLTNLKAAFWIYNSKCLIMLIFFICSTAHCFTESLQISLALWTNATKYRL